MIRVYTASKLGQAPMWRELAKTWPHVHFHARWLKHNEVGTPDTAENAIRFWREDIEDVKTADVVLVYAEDGEHLRGALVEAGAAIAFGVPVVVVGSHPDFSTWQFHAGVRRALDMHHAGEILAEIDRST